MYRISFFFFFFFKDIIRVIFTYAGDTYRTWCRRRNQIRQFCPPPPNPPTPLPHPSHTHPLSTQKATICAEGMWRWNETQGLLVGWWSLGDLTLQQARKMPSLVWLSFTPNKVSGVWLSLGPWLVTRLPSSASWWCWESWCLDSPSMVGCFYSSPPVLSFFRIWNVLKNLLLLWNTACLMTYLKKRESCLKRRKM